MKKKSKFKKGRSSRENDNKRKRFMGDKLGENEKEKFKNDEKKRKKEMLDNLKEEKKNIP